MVPLRTERLSELPATFTTGQAERAGLWRRDLYLLRDVGVVNEISRGVFRKVDAPETAHLDLLAVAHRAPLLHTVKALAYGKKGNADQCQRSTELAADCYRPETVADDPPWIQFFTPAKLTGDLANAMFDLLVASSLLLGHAEATRNTSRARADLVTQLSATVNGYSQERARSKAIAASRLATLLYLEGAPTEANTAARTALTLARDVRSARLGSDLRLLARAAGAAPRDTLAQTVRTQANVLAVTMI